MKQTCEERRPWSHWVRRGWRRLFFLNFAVAIVAAGLFLLFSDVHTLFGFFQLLASCFIYSFSIGTLCALVLTRFPPEQNKWPFALDWLLVCAEIALSVAAGAFIASVILLVVGLQSPSHFWADLYVSIKFSVILGLTFGVGMVLYETTRGRLEATQLELRQKQVDEERARKLAAEARLSSLESRIHPHFLFNTLNSIAALIPEDPRQAEEIVQKLAALLRFSLDAGQRRLVPLAQEVRTVADYLEIEKARLGERLCYTLDVPEELGPAELPPLSLQTLVENAVKHAVAPRREGGRIRIGARRDDACLVVEVADDGPGFGPADIPAGHGLDNLQERLVALFGERGRLEVNGSAGMTLVRLVLPLTRAQTGAIT
jgi:sensor histidine kinase YesM